MACKPNGFICQGGACVCGGGGTPQVAETNCSDGRDNDCDGLTDCADSTCANLSCGPNLKVCKAAICTCLATGMPPSATENKCTDGIDQDCDGLIDCADGDCLGLACQMGVPQNVCIAASTCACGLAVTDLTNLPGQNMASLVAYSGRQAVLTASTNNILYTECTAGCATAMPTWSPAISLNNFAINANSAAGILRPVLKVLDGGTLAAFFRDGASQKPAHYQECTAGCTAPGAWSNVNLSSNASGGTSTFDALQSLRSVAYETFISAAVKTTTYEECSSNCTSSLSWSQADLNFDPFGAAIRLTPFNGGVLRTLVLGSSGPAMRYGECTANCNLLASWAFIDLHAGTIPDLVIDRSGLPRVFAVDNLAPYDLRTTRCLQRPCTDAGSWTVASVVSDAGGFVSAGLAPDGGTFFSSSDSSGRLVIGREAPNGGYSNRFLNDCAGVPLQAAAVTVLPDGNDQWTACFRNATTSQHVARELP